MSLVQVLLWPGHYSCMPSRDGRCQHQGLLKDHLMVEQRGSGHKRTPKTAEQSPVNPARQYHLLFSQVCSNEQLKEKKTKIEIMSFGVCQDKQNSDQEGLK